MSLVVVLEEKDFLVVEKPGGIATQPLTSPRTPSLLRRGPGGGTLAHLVAKKFPEIRSVGGADWGAVHRLDRDTSGLVVFARNQGAYDALREAFSKNEVEKEYTALVEGAVEAHGKIDWPIGPDPKSDKKVKVYRNVAEARRNKAQEAVTTLTPIPLASTASERLPTPARGRGVTTLLKVVIKTGRRHQIRVHLAAIGHPIVGDALYGGPKADRLYLHASRLKFRYPRDPKDPKPARWVEASSPSPFSSESPSGR
ncbi:MAG TPA: RluA family pseudouridine synthase [bacterium]|nr:RluA family pseudouridine synthase [bacterium]